MNIRMQGGDGVGALVYTWLNNGKPKGFFKDELSLLISYDMMPLRGLEETKRVLNEKGQIATGRLVKGDEAGLFVVYRNGIPDLDAIDWGCHDDTYDRCLRALCHYVSYMRDYPKENQFGISEKENLKLREYHWRSLSSDKRRQRPLGRPKPQVEKILDALGFRVESVVFVQETAVSGGERYED